MTLLKHELRTNRTSVLIWSGILCAMTALTMLLYPSFKDQMGTLSSVMSMLGPFSAALGLDQIDMSAAIGFYGVESGTMLTIGGTMFAAFTGIGLLSKEEGGHTAEFLLTLPIPRSRVVFDKLLALLVLLVFFNLVCAAVGLLCFLMIAEPVPMGRFLLFHGLQFLLHLEIGCVCFALSAFFRRAQTGLGLGIALLLYFLGLLINVVDATRFLRYVTPFAYADASAVLSGKLPDAALLLIGFGVMAASVGLSLWQYTRKNIEA